MKHRVLGACLGLIFAQEAPSPFTSQHSRPPTEGSIQMTTLPSPPCST